MTQTIPYANGTKVLYGAFDHNSNMSEDRDYEATIVGYTHLDDNLHYVLEGHSDISDGFKFFIRRHEQVRIDTTLHRYIGNYIELEVEA